MPAEDQPLPEPVKLALERHGFYVERYVGGGASGAVYRAQQRRLGRTVAVKVFNVEISRDSAALQRFKREASLLARLNHPAVPYVLTAGEAAGRPYHVMQFIEGDTLAARLGAERVLDPAVAVPIARHILSALDHAHARKLVHRDVSPDNVMLRGDSAYLIDFSLGFSENQEAGLTRATQDGRALGRAAYASPEQRKNARDVDHRTDIFAVGVLLLEMLTGDTTLSIIADSASSLLLPAYRELIRDACSPDAASRVASAKDFLSRLGTFDPAGVPSPAKRLALCESLSCSEAIWGERGYFKGPHIEETNAAFCGASGSKFVTGCLKCGATLPKDLRERILVTKRGAQRIAVHCGRCGHLLFRTPTCPKCRSLLTAPERAVAQQDPDCDKCRVARVDPFPPSSDDEIPF